MTEDQRDHRTQYEIVGHASSAIVLPTTPVTTRQREWWFAQVVAHIADGWSLVRVGTNLRSKSTLIIETRFPTELVPLDLRALGSELLISWQGDTSEDASARWGGVPWAAMRKPPKPG